jgi:hypothetical protein
MKLGRSNGTAHVDGAVLDLGWRRAGQCWIDLGWRRASSKSGARRRPEAKVLKSRCGGRAAGARVGSGGGGRAGRGARRGSESSERERERGRARGIFLDKTITSVGHL